MLRSIVLCLAIAAQTPATWNGVTLGVPVSTLRATIGDPLRVIVSDDGTVRVGRYWLPGSPDTFFLVVERQGYVSAFHAFASDLSAANLGTIAPDPSGVHLGDTQAAVAALHPSESGAAVTYEFRDGRVRSFDWATEIAPGKPALAALTTAAGDSLGSAIVDMQKNESDGVDWEYLYLAFHPCDGEAKWKLQKQSLLNPGGRVYDRMHVVCPTTKAERDFYFDITHYFGKL